MLLPRSFYLRENVVEIAEDLLGKMLFTQVDGQITSGIISETEAYAGITDKASHAYGNRRTNRTEVMYKNGGTAYVYLCYGVHSLFNIVTNKVEIPHAVLIRGIIPCDGLNIMLERTGKKSQEKGFGIGPGKVTKALGIHYSQTGIDLTRKPGRKSEPFIWLEEGNYKIRPEMIITTPRIGVEYSGNDALLPYRFILNR